MILLASAMVLWAIIARVSECLRAFFELSLESFLYVESRACVRECVNACVCLCVCVSRACSRRSTPARHITRSQRSTFHCMLTCVILGTLYHKHQRG